MGAAEQWQLIEELRRLSIFSIRENLQTAAIVITNW